MDEGRVSRPFKLTDGYVKFIGIVRCLFSMPYRQIEGFRALNRLIPKLPPIDYSWVRRCILGLDLNPYNSLRDSSEPITIAVDSSGVSIHKCSG
jgi:hypothetical protein